MTASTLPWAIKAAAAESQMRVAGSLSCTSSYAVKRAPARVAGLGLLAIAFLVAYVGVIAVPFLISSDCGAQYNAVVGML